MLKYFVYKNTYFIIGCLVLIIIMALISKNYNSSIEGFSYGIIKSNYDAKISCGTNWQPVSTSAGFIFKNSNYTTVYMLNSNLDDITQLFDNYIETKFNIDCSNTLYSVANNIYSKYSYNNSIIKYNPFILKDNSPAGSFYECLIKLANDNKPNIYFSYESKNTNSSILTLTMVNPKNSNNKYIFKMELNAGGKKIIDEKLKLFLKQNHSTYSSTTGVSGFKLDLIDNNTKSNITVYKNDGTNDPLSRENVPKFTTLIYDLRSSVLSMSNITNGYLGNNLINTSSSIKYMCGTIEYGGNKDYVIVQIPNFTN